MSFAYTHVPEAGHGALNLGFPMDQVCALCATPPFRKKPRKNGAQVEGTISLPEMDDAGVEAVPEKTGSEWKQMLLPSRVHTARSAAVLLGGATLLSALVGLVRTKYIAHVFGATPAMGAYQAAFEMPDMLGYLIVGGSISITLVSMLSRIRAEGDDERENLAMSVILNAMSVVLGVAIVLAEIFAPIYTRYKFPMFAPDQLALCTSLTRIILLQPFFLFAGGVLGSRLLVRKIFVYQAITPLIYGIGVIAGGVLFSHSAGIYSLAYGVVGGAFAGPFLLTAIGAYRSGMRYKPVLNLRHPLFLEWLRISLPLMIGVSLVIADKWILTYFSSIVEITHINMAKTVFQSPLMILGQAAGAASLPFFASLFAQKKIPEFSASVDRAVTRVAAISLLATSWMVVLATPLVALLVGGGRYTPQDTATTAQYFTIFTFSLALWAAQAIYGRAFYAAGNTLTPAIAGTAITVGSIPVYALLFHFGGMTGLMWASNFGITLQVSVLAILLHRKRLVSLAELEWGELGRSLLASVVSWFALMGFLRVLPAMHGRLGNLITLATASVVWAGVVYGMLRVTGSRLPQEVLRRRSAKTT
ncbi:virulence factor MVIN family protein [Terriglobus saanensis SP1PR4]|uniref:Virulence factor MVIN family protein n=2 Tax=Terriglobus saanensis TaxID=870903 RepID=E8V3N4_TERSS|nr:virulence factor MVIN family protein [Terriglobus saanensis SP1PR4]